MGLPAEVWFVLLVLAVLVSLACFVLSLVRASFSIPSWLFWLILVVYGVFLLGLPR
jgi:hypothetical protein